MLGYSRDEMLGMNVSVWEAKLTKEDISYFLEKMSSKQQTIQTKLRRKDGSIFDAEVSFSKISILHVEYVYSSTRDISEYLLTQSQQRLAALVYEKSSDAMTITDVDAVIISANTAFEKLTGYINEELVGKSIKILQSGMQDKEYYSSMWDNINHYGSWQGKVTDRKKDGALFTKWLEIMTVFDESNQPFRHIAEFTDITDEKLTQQQLWYQANFDILTELPNRSMFMFRLEKRLQDIDLFDVKVGVFYIDLDNFKEINESMGHDKGDLLLQETAKRIKQCTKDEDIVFRIGGDEFTVVFPRLENLERIETSVEVLLKELARPFEIAGNIIYISASIGITITPEDGFSAEAMLKNAEQAMYAAKHAGRNNFRYFTQSMQEKILRRMKLVEEMRKAIEEKQFVLYYQPIMELATGQIHKAEALIRWKKSDGSMMSPAEFIPLAEETGLIVELGEWIIQEAATTAKRWRELYDERFQISINKSPVQFKSPKFGNSLEVDILKALDLPSDAIVVEITEGLLMETTPLVKEKLLRFEEQGIAISLDDFGTGYSSLSYLKKFHIDFLKIDQSFVRNLSNDKNDQTLCEAIVAMSHKLGIKVIAEGVEELDQEEFLNSISCDYIQGYIISRPIEASEFENRFLEKNKHKD
jgi:diguanylate cyclase (GGDEF)-like protein/PAS domain S-box-containing protein